MIMIIMSLPGCGLAGFPLKNLKWCIKSQVNAPLMSHKFRSDATSTMDLWILVSNFLIEDQALQFLSVSNLAIRRMTYWLPRVIEQ